MQPPLVNDDLWTRRGITLLWDAAELNQICTASQVISMRMFMQHEKAGWPEDSLPLINEKLLVVSGIEACIDSLSPDEATQWLIDTVYPALVSFQSEVADGGGQAALVFWIVDQKRLVFNHSDNAWLWHCAGEHKNEKIPIGNCLFNGAQKDIREVQNTQGKKKGLYHPRIS